MQRAPVTGIFATDALRTVQSFAHLKAARGSHLRRRFHSMHMILAAATMRFCIMALQKRITDNLLTFSPDAA